MQLDAARRLDDSIRSDFAHVQDTHSARIAGYDAEHLDPASHTARWSKGEVPLWEGVVELVARYSPDLGVFRWWWTMQVDALAQKSRLDRAYAEAQQGKLPPLLQRQIVLDDAADAEMLSRLACHFARAHGLLARAEGASIAYYALFESAASLERVMTSPPPAINLSSGQYARSMPPPAVAPVRSASQPAPPIVLREPSLELIYPVARAASISIKHALGGAFQSAIMVVVIDTSREKARFYVQLVAISPFGELEAPDTSRELMDAVTAMIIGDSKSGNARWHKLILRFSPDGSSVTIGKVEIS